MRVLNLMLAKARGGMESMAVRYHEALAAEGVEVASVGHPAGALASLPPVEFRPLVAHFDYDPRALWRLASVVRRFKPNLILTHGGRATGLCLAAGLATKTVQVMHNEFFKSYSRRARAALCVSRSVLEAAKVAYPNLKLIEMSNFTHLEAHPVKTAMPASPVLGSVGRLHDQKGFDIMLRALARLNAKGVGFTARIAGTGPELGALERLRGQLKLESVVEFADWVSPVGDFLRGLDLFVMASRYEPFGLALAEALAAGVPAVASGIEGPLEILDGGRFGRLFRMGDDLALAEAIEAALADWNATRAMALAGQAHALENYSFDSGRKRLGAALQYIAAG